MTETKPIAWSGSRLNDFGRCPAMFEHKHILKDAPYIESPQMAEGKRQHKAMENRVREGAVLPAEYARLEPLAAAISAIPGETHCELDLALDQYRQPCGYKDWDRAWVRATIDVMKLDGSFAWLGDYKTGSPTFDEFQLKLYAAVVFDTYQQVETVATSYIWLKTRTTDPMVYTRDSLQDIWNEIMVPVTELQEAYLRGVFSATPSKRICGYCDVNRMGKCQYAACPARK